MQGMHWVTLGIGVLIGWLIWPQIIGMFMSKGQ